MSAIDPLDLPAQLQAREEQIERARLAQRIEVSDLHWLMADKRGRRFVFRLLEQAELYRDPWTPNANQTAHNLGRQAYARWLEVQVRNYCPESYMLMAREAREVEYEHDRHGDGPKSN